MSELEALFERYKALDYVPSLEEERELLYSYVYSTNRLEGNQLSLLQTTELLSENRISGDHIRTQDILEQKGMYKALTRRRRAVHHGEALSIALILELNWLVIGSLWKDEDAYLTAKEKGQKTGHFKAHKNRIHVTRHEGKTLRITPLSTPENVHRNMKYLLQGVERSPKGPIEKAVYVAQELWLHQPFVDGNKRTGRLLINFLTLKEGYPLFTYEGSGRDYNALLLEQYLSGKPGLLAQYVERRLKAQLKAAIDNCDPDARLEGFRMLL